MDGEEGQMRQTLWQYSQDDSLTIIVKQRTREAGVPGSLVWMAHISGIIPGFTTYLVGPGELGVLMGTH